VELVHLERYRIGATEFSQAIRMLPKTNADVIMIIDYLNDTSLELMRELREAGNTQPIIGDDGLEFPLLIKESLNDLAGDIYLVNVYDDDQHGAFLKKKFEELSEFLPPQTKATFKANYPTYQGYKAASLFAQAAAESQSSVPLFIASRLKHATGEGWNSMSGNAIHFDSRGDISNPEFILKKYHDGTFKRFTQEAGL
jgi:ABC-type branched-subunit amino acid transport system substrate-binding protein